MQGRESLPIPLAECNYWIFAHLRQQTSAASDERPRRQDDRPLASSITQMDTFKAGWVGVGGGGGGRGYLFVHPLLCVTWNVQRRSV